MVGRIIGSIINLGCAVLFYGIGIYASKSKTPMWFWSGAEVDPSSISNVTAYNQQNARMWKQYSLWYRAGVIGMFINEMITFYALLAGGTIGIILLVCTYKRIEVKYKTQH